MNKDIKKTDSLKGSIMNIDTLKMFIMIAQKGSISAAAEELGYAQSNISTRVHRLEDDLQAQLFYRSAQGVTLTSSGQEFYTQAIKIVGIADAAVNNLKHPQEVNGTLKLGTLQTAASTFLPSVLAKYHQNNPNVEISIETGTTLKSANDVLNYKLDGAIIGGMINEKQLELLPLFNEKICLVTSHNKEVDIQNDSLLVFPTGCAYRKTLENWLDSQKVMIHHPIEFNYLNAIIASVSAGLGISILPERVIKPYVDSKALSIRQLPEKFATLPVSFIYRKDHIPNKAFNNFINVLKEDHI